MPQAFKNNFTAVLTASVAFGDTQIYIDKVLDEGLVSYPTRFFELTITKPDGAGGVIYEVVRVNSLFNLGLGLNVTRDVSGSPFGPENFPSGSTVSANLTAGALDRLWSNNAGSLGTNPRAVGTSALVRGHESLAIGEGALVGFADTVVSGELRQPSTAYAANEVRYYSLNEVPYGRAIKLTCIRAGTTDAGASLAIYQQTRKLKDGTVWWKVEGWTTTNLAIGKDAGAHGQYSLSLGNLALSATAKDIAIGYNSNAGGGGAVAIGTDTIVFCDSGVSLGSSAGVHANEGIAIGPSSVVGMKTFDNDAPLWTASTVISPDSLTRFIDEGDPYNPKKYWLYTKDGGTTGATIDPLNFAQYFTDGSVTWRLIGPGDFGIALGKSARCYGTDGIAIGHIAECEYTSGVALGNFSKATHENSMALGPFAAAKAERAIALAGTVYHPDAIRLGAGETLLPEALFTKYPGTLGASPKPNYAGAAFNPASYSTGLDAGLEGYIMSPAVDLAGGSTWQANTAYKKGYAVKPTSPNGFQYICDDYNYPLFTNPTLIGYTGSLSDATQPIWPTVNGDTASETNMDWFAIKITDGSFKVPLPTDAYFMVTEVLFIAYDVSAITVQPTISIGQTGNLTKVINAAQTSGLTSSMSVFKFTLAQPVLLTPDITIKVDTQATGTRLLGRFAFKGALTRHWV